MNRTNEIDRVYLNHLRTSKTTVLVTTDEHPTDDASNTYEAKIVAFTSTMLIVEMDVPDVGSTQCAIFFDHIVSLVPKGKVNIIFEHQKGV